MTTTNDNREAHGRSLRNNNAGRSQQKKKHSKVAGLSEVVERCRFCGGTNVLVLRWVNPNTGEVSHKASGTEMLHPYCNDCEDTTNLKSD